MNSIPETSGIYMITCTANDKIYIGSSNNLRMRWHGHRCLLRKGNHPNPHLQNAWNKYGEDSFKFEVLEYVLPFATTIREQKWLDKLKPFGKRGFNIAHNAENPTMGKPCLPETRKKIGDANRGRLVSAETRAKISERSKNASAETRMKISVANKGRVLSAEQKDNLSKANSKEWIVTSPDGQETRILSLTRFCRANGLDIGTMGQVAKGVWSHHKGWKCRYGN